MQLALYREVHRAPEDMFANSSCGLQQIAMRLYSCSDTLSLLDLRGRRAWVGWCWGVFGRNSWKRPSAILSWIYGGSIQFWSGLVRFRRWTAEQRSPPKRASLLVWIYMYVSYVMLEISIGSYEMVAICEHWNIRCRKLHMTWLAIETKTTCRSLPYSMPTGTTLRRSASNIHSHFRIALKRWHKMQPITIREYAKSSRKFPAGVSAPLLLFSWSSFLFQYSLGSARHIFFLSVILSY